MKDYLRSLFVYKQVLLTLVLALGWLQLSAQVAGQTYTDERAGYQLTYPEGWSVFQSESQSPVTFYVGNAPRAAPAVVALIIQRPSGAAGLSAAISPLDSVWKVIRRLPQARVLRLEAAAPNAQEVRYDYTFASPQGRRHVVGRQLSRGNDWFQIEYRALAAEDQVHLGAGRQLVASLKLKPARKSVAALPATVAPDVPKPAEPVSPCNDKMYGIAALRVHDGLWEDDCRTIHEFSVEDPSEPPIIHRRVLPFQSYALAKGFDNCLYSVTKASSDTPEYIYRYNPATRQGQYTPWLLPAQGPENIWISASTGQHGELYFITSDANLLVKVNPADGAVTVVWDTDPLRQVRYYHEIGFSGAGTHANFCLDEDHTLYQVYSTDGSLIRVDLKTRKAAPERLPLAGLPERGGYSDVLLQYDAEGNRVFYLAGPSALYVVDAAHNQASRVRRGVYTDLAGCNVMRPPAPPPAAPVVVVPPPVPPPAEPLAYWQGRVLDAATLGPLARVTLQLSNSSNVIKADTTLALKPDALFSTVASPSRALALRAERSGYFPLDTTLLLRPGVLVHDVLLRPLTVGSVLRLDKVQFEQGKNALLSSSYADLERLLTLLQANPSLTIELRGHTDNVGDPKKNVLLSEERVQAVKTYLVNHGIAEARITGIGLGGAEPRASNDQEPTRRLNRRVEFRVTGGG
ncbi:OmpA family protein [Hymenobacter lutimineralis]|uniref:OmpA family protein n=1 Tax=Hymenobacter lutimineralis TaxID=2606448 RepID=A0A5D6USF1_9BACT|nr:OmpA family protein [Hymenobacter lutimineralis]TYZ06631.1 OmpA family protein [Hymenobacter lutimineralis]